MENSAGHDNPFERMTEAELDAKLEEYRADMTFEDWLELEDFAREKGWTELKIQEAREVWGWSDAFPVGIEVQANET